MLYKQNGQRVYVLPLSFVTYRLFLFVQTSNQWRGLVLNFRPKSSQILWIWRWLFSHVPGSRANFKPRFLFHPWNRGYSCMKKLKKKRSFMDWAVWCHTSLFHKKREELRLFTTWLTILTFWNPSFQAVSSNASSGWTVRSCFFFFLG